MTALVLENTAGLRTLATFLRSGGLRLSEAVDRIVRARAVRAIPEWRMREVRNDIARYRGLGRARRRYGARRSSTLKPGSTGS
jgi:hypothetical protein